MTTLNVRSKVKSNRVFIYNDTEAIELMEITSEDINTTFKGVERETTFIEAGERDKILLLRELEGLHKQLRTIRRSLK